jgi:PAS domain S-box-containing protein
MRGIIPATDADYAPVRALAERLGLEAWRRRNDPAAVGLSFRAKINCGIVLIVGLIAIPLAYLTWRAAAKSLLAETRKRGIVLSENLSVRVSDAMLSMDLLRLKNMVDELGKLDDIVYAFILDRQGSVLVHSFNGGFPVALTDVNRPQQGTLHIQLLDTGKEFIDDFAAPVSIVGTDFGTVRIGLSRTKAEAAADRLALLIVFFSGAAMVAALIPSTLFARGVTGRINRLKAHAEEVVKGNLDQRAGLPVERACSEILACDKTHCPAHDDRLRRCWLIAAPSVRDGAPPSCKACPVYREHKGDEIQDLAETFDVMAESLTTHLSELRKAERVLSRQEQLLRTILDATPDFLCLLDENLSYLAVNRAFTAFVGREATEIVGRSDRDIFPPDEGPAAHAENRRVLASSHPTNREVFLQRGAAPMWLHIVRVPVTDRDGRPMGLVRTARDVTRIKQFQESSSSPRKWNPWASWPAAWPTRSTPPSASFSAMPSSSRKTCRRAARSFWICKPSRNRPRSVVRSWPTCSDFPARPKAPKSRCASTTPSWRRPPWCAMPFPWTR